MNARTGRRRSWLTAPVLSVAGLSLGAGISAFGVTAVVGDVAATFGEVTVDDGSLGRIGLPVTTVGIALAVVRAASLGSLWLAAVADRHGRRRVLLSVAAVGYGLSSLAALSPGFWWYVALVALARPCLSALNAVAGVVAAEASRSVDRAGALGLIAAAYGLGSGIVSVGRGLLPGDPSFRVVAAFSLVPLLLVPLLAPHVSEPAIARGRVRADGLPGAVPRLYRRRVAVLAFLVGMIAMATGPGFTYLFVYGERVLHASPLEVAALVLAAGPMGLIGILLGRWGADRFGRRVTGAVTLGGTGLAVAVAYSGGFGHLAVGYLCTVLLGGAFAPAQGALAAELVPTAIRATVAGWLTVTGVIGAVLGLATFGIVADATGGFTVAAWSLGGIVAASAVVFHALPETRGLELEDLEA
ncbi:MFS transporter [Nitriliruptor alkaliphilus]|uniref:MFS transporter n=1 Tax=Nitriliruptor alkaliphilus TaxID=427918 RepID=UPI0006985268|nr:MFS transporter [Nitriliruptor alkaliphilus]